MLETSKINLFYGKSQILYDIDLQAQKGQVTCVLDTNAVGKTSPMPAILGAQAVAAGHI